MKTREQRIKDGHARLCDWRETLEREMNHAALEQSRHDPYLNPNIFGYLEARSKIRNSQPKPLRSYLWLNPTGMSGPRLTRPQLEAFRWWVHN